MISVEAAIETVLAHTVVLSSEHRALGEARGRFLAEPIIADSDLPPFDRSQMDGYALRAEDVKSVPIRLRVVGESAAGRGWHEELKPGQAVRIMTGAPVPAGADSVQKVELTREIGKDGLVEIFETVASGRSIVKRGSEIEQGVTVLTAGMRIDAAAMAVLAAFGYSKVMVGRQPRVSVLATGTELVPVDQKPGQDQIRDSNNYSLRAYAEISGAVVDLPTHSSDDTAALQRQIEIAAERSDAVVTSGGVSMGAYDFTKLALRKLNAEIFFEKVALKPGKPTVFARLPSGKLVFGLPGNPVSVAVTFNLFARPALLAMQGANQTSLTCKSAILGRTAHGSADRESYLPAQLFTNDSGQLIAEPIKWGGSSDFVAFARASALIHLPAGDPVNEAGAIVRVVCLPT